MPSVTERGQVDFIGQQYQQNRSRDRVYITFELPDLVTVYVQLLWNNANDSLRSPYRQWKCCLQFCGNVLLRNGAGQLATAVRH